MCCLYFAVCTNLDVRTFRVLLLPLRTGSGRNKYFRQSSGQAITLCAVKDALESEGEHIKSTENSIYQLTGTHIDRMFDRRTLFDTRKGRFPGCNPPCWNIRLRLRVPHSPQKGNRSKLFPPDMILPTPNVSKKVRREGIDARHPIRPMGALCGQCGDHGWLRSAVGGQPCL